MKRESIKEFALITMGIFLVAVSVVYFFEPNNIAAGGITGLAIVINHYIPFISIGPLVLMMDAILFIVAIINAINLIDGLDGLAGGTCSIFFLTISIIAFFLDRFRALDVTLCLIMLGATLGFLVYNFNPASIFMGDTGSMFLGFMIAVIALLGYKAATVTSLIIPIIILFLPILDTILAMIRRIIKGENIGMPDKEHIHHQLLKLNKSTRKTVLIMYGINIICASISIFYALGDNKISISLYAVLLIILIILIFKTDILFKHDK